VWLGVSTKSGIVPTNFISLAGQNSAVSWKTGFKPNVSSRLSSAVQSRLTLSPGLLHNWSIETIVKERTNVMKISVIVGSTRQGRFSEKPAQWILQQLQKREGIEAQLLDLRDFQMPFFDQPLPPAMPGRPPYEHEVVKKWTAQIAASDAFVFVTPEYNYGTSAVLKNAIDWVYPEWNRKAAGFVGYGSAMGARAVQQLRETAIEVQMAPIRSSVHIPVATLWAHFQGGDVDKGLAELEKQANVMIDDLTWWTAALKAARDDLWNLLCGFSNDPHPQNDHVPFRECRRAIRQLPPRHQECPLQCFLLPVAPNVENEVCGVSFRHPRLISGGGRLYWWSKLFYCTNSIASAEEREIDRRIVACTTSPLVAGGTPGEL
jgi:NAD(P)H-dependent FMN reductase